MRRLPTLFCLIVLLLTAFAGLTDAQGVAGQIESTQPAAGQAVDKEFWTDDVLTSKLFLGPTGRALKRGEGYFAIDTLFLPVFQVGVTDRLSFGMGFPLYGLVKTAGITPKFQVYRSETVAVSTGVLHLFIPGSFEAGYGYVATTVGSADKSITFGGGMLYGYDKDSSGTLPAVTIGGERRTSRRTKLVTENYIFKEGVVASVGERFIGPGFSAELGAIIPMVGKGAFPGFFVNLIWHSRPSGRR